jgi:hypothetical protein
MPIQMFVCETFASWRSSAWPMQSTTIGERDPEHRSEREDGHLGRTGVTRLRINSLAANQSVRATYEHAGFCPYEIMYEKTIVAED